MIPEAARDPFRTAACVYLGYGVVYLVGGLYLVAHGIGVAGGRASGAIAPAMLKWGLLGSIPLIGIPLLLWRPWSLLGGWLSRRTLAWLVVAMLALRAFKVGEVAVRAGGSVPAPWGGEITFQAGAVVFLAVALVALAFTMRAAWMGDSNLPRTAGPPGEAEPDGLQTRRR